MLSGENGVHHEHGKQGGSKNNDGQHGRLAASPAQSLTLMEEQGVHGEDKILSADSSKVKVAVIATDEELMIATDTYNLVK